MILQPQNSFTLVRQITNHLDTDTLYVRAVIRNAFTDVIIDTLDLTDKGSQRFKKDWQVSADPSGQGFYVSVVTSVYTDSGYTTKSANYGDEENTYLIQERVLGSLKSGGGLSIAETRRILKEEIALIAFPKQKEAKEIPKQKEYDTNFKEIAKGLMDIKDLIASLPSENVNLSPVVSRLNDLVQEIKTKPVTPETDVTSIIKAIADVKEDTDLNSKETKEIFKSLGDNLTGIVKEMLPSIMENLNFSIPMSLGNKKEKEVKTFNINNLAK